MTVLVALPDSPEGSELAEASVCGFLLIVRVLAGAARAGASDFVLLERSPEQNALLQHVIASPALAGFSFRVIHAGKFNPQNTKDWETLRGTLPHIFLWLPWNLIIEKTVLKQLMAGERLFAGAPESDGNIWNRAMVLHRDGLPGGLLPDTGVQTRTGGSHPILVTSRSRIPQTERYLIRNSGKETDGLYSRMNRAMCRPFLAWLCRTPVTPNAITVLGLLLSALSAWSFAQGHWSAYVWGAFLYFACVLCDEIDGMLARLTFSDSALGCWLETVADYASYLFLFGGLTIGLYRQSGVFWLWTGLAMMAGSALVMLVLSYQRKRITEPGHPQEFRKKLQHALERDSRNPVSWLGRNLEFMIRKPAYCYWVLIFCTLGLTKVLVFLTAFGANVAWMMALSYNRLFRSEPVREPLRGVESQ